MEHQKVMTAKRGRPGLAKIWFHVKHRETAGCIGTKKKKRSANRSKLLGGRMKGLLKKFIALFITKTILTKPA